MEMALQPALLQLKDRQLNSVNFVENYVEFDFGEARLTAYTSPETNIDGKRIISDNPEYRDSLYRLEGETLQNVSVKTGDKLTISFSRGSTLSISLRNEDYRSVEALMYRASSGQLWIV